MKRQKNISKDEGPANKKGKKFVKSNKPHKAHKGKGKMPLSIKHNRAKKNPKFEKSAIKSKSDNNKFTKPKDSKFGKGKPNLDREKVKKTNPKQDENGAASEKPNWTEYKQQQKELRDKRRAKKLDDTYEIASQAKQIGEKLRRVKLSAEAQVKLTKKFHDLVENHYAKLIFTHDMSRVIQWQVKYCSADIQLAIVAELKPHFQEMFASKYAKNVIRTLLKRGSDNVKQSIVETCNGHVVKLLTSVVSASLFEKIYVEVAKDSQKLLFKQEFYGDLYKSSKEPSIKTLTDVWKDSETMKSATLSAVKANLVRILNKNLINSSLVHTILYEFLTNCSKEDRAEVSALVRPLIAELSQTRDGAKAANLCIWHGTNKDRKLIMKTLKEHVKSIMTSEHGHLMVLALLDSIDDTVLLKKILLQEVLNNLNDIVQNEYGKRVILYIVARRDTRYFHPALIEYLKLGDGNESSKKPAEIREKELLDNVIDNLLENVANDAKTWLSNGPISLVTLAILKASHGEKPKAAFEAIAKFIVDPSSELQVEDKVCVAVEDAALHMVLKKLIQMDKQRVEAGELTFGESIVQHLTEEGIEHWSKYNRSLFLLICLLENESEKVTSELKEKLKKFVSKLKTQKTKGAEILLKKLK